jgi:transcriptional regulator with XRE-family HTH domain
MPRKPSQKPSLDAIEPSQYWAERLYPSAIINASPADLALRIFETGLGPDLRNELMPHGFSAPEIRNWIKALARRLEISPTELAKAAKLSPSTVTRFIGDESKLNNVNADTIDALLQAGTNLLVEKIRPEKLKTELAKNDSGFLNEPDFTPIPLRIKVRGSVKSGEWSSSVEWPDYRQQDLIVPIPYLYSNHPIIALEVQDNEVTTGPFSYGSIVFSVPFYSLGRAPWFEEFVVVHRHNEGGLVEASIRQFVLDPQGHAWLLPAPGRLKVDAPIPLGATRRDADPEGVIITASIISTYRIDPVAEKQRRHYAVMQQFDMKELPDLG